MPSSNEPLIDLFSMDLVADFAAPLPMLVIAEMLGIPTEDRPLFHQWADVILAMSYTIGGPQDAARAAHERFAAVTVEMSTYLSTLLAAPRGEPGGDLLARLHSSEVDGVRLTLEEILGFFQLLLLAGSDRTGPPPVPIHADQDEGITWSCSQESPKREFP
jgi:cytochrome P450